LARSLTAGKVRRHLVWRQNLYQVAVVLYAPVSESATGLEGAQCPAK
jgi:hypothetical protein